jgi:hypothetical protein
MHYPNASRLLVLADSGGSNSSNRWAWKTQIQTQLSNAFALQGDFVYLIWPLSRV